MTFCICLKKSFFETSEINSFTMRVRWLQQNDKNFPLCAVNTFNTMRVKRAIKMEAKIN